MRLTIREEMTYNGDITRHRKEKTMKQIQFGTTGKQPAVIVGCMRISEFSGEEMNSFIHTSLENGANFFDHADIYGGGRCEEVFGEALAADSSIRREDIILQTKCGIRRGQFDFSKEHILEAVEGSLKRLHTDYIDVLLLHRPDALIDPEEVADAFNCLQESGKVRCFGVSNFNPFQIELLQKYIGQKLQANQLQFSLAASNMIAQGLEVNMETAGSVGHDGSVLDYCRLHDITVQAWSAFQKPAWRGTFVGDYEEYGKLNKVMDELAEKYAVTPTGIAAAWILRHPAGMQVVTGTSKESRLKEIFDGAEVRLTREEWYRLYLATGHILP